jgi:hypothetical protein
MPARRLALAALATLLLATATAWAASALREQAAEAQAFHAVTLAAALSGRDPDAALRKARFTASLLAREFGMTRAEAAAEVARFMIVRGGRLCNGG